MSTESPDVIGGEVGVAGVGRMGRHFALHLAAAGHRVLVYDPHVHLDHELARAGVQMVEHPADLVTVPVSLSMLPDGDAALSFLAGEGGAFSAAVPGHVHVLMGTMGPGTVAELGRQAEHHGVLLADAPVSGSVAAARARTLTTMVGATHELYARLAPVLQAITGRQFHVGALGAGTVVKLAVNVVVGAINEAVNEALLLATGSGVDRDTFYEVLASGAGGGTYVEYKRDVFLDPGNPGVDAPVTIIDKDLTLALELATELGLELPGLAACRAVARRAVEQGIGANDLARVGLALDGPGTTPRGASGTAAALPSGEPTND